MIRSVIASGVALYAPVPGPLAGSGSVDHDALERRRFLRGLRPGGGHGRPAMLRLDRGAQLEHPRGRVLDERPGLGYRVQAPKIQRI